MKRELRGAYPALLTPFKGEKLYEKGLEQLLGYCLQKGAAGFYVGGSTGEGFLMRKEERIRLLTAVKEIVGERAALIAYTGSLRLSEAVELSETAAKLGYDAISSVPPFYYDFGFRAVKEYYGALAQTGLPLLIYSIASSGVRLDFGKLCELLEMENVAGLKFTESDFFLLQQLKAKYPEKIIFNGKDEMLASGLIAGADGGIGSTYNLMEDKYVAVCDAVRRGDAAEAARVQASANEITAALLRVGVIPGLKVAMEMVGVDVGECLRPFAPLTAEERAFLRGALEKGGIL